MKHYWSVNKVPFYFFLFLYFIDTSFLEVHLKHTFLDFKDLKYKWSILEVYILKIYSPYSFFCKGSQGTQFLILVPMTFFSDKVWERKPEILGKKTWLISHYYFLANYFFPATSQPCCPCQEAFLSLYCWLQGIISRPKETASRRTRESEEVSATFIWKLKKVSRKKMPRLCSSMI